MNRLLVRRRHCISLVAACLGGGAWGPAAGNGGSRILVVGDSLSAEYGLRRGTGWVALLDKEIQSQKRPATVVNASISGDTTSGGRSRLPALLKQHKPTHLIVALGGNDALRGLPVTLTESNLRDMAQAGRAAGAKVMIVGIEMPPNYGTKYTKDFAAIFDNVARSEKAALVRSLLAGVSDDPDPLRLFQADRIHPVEAAQPLMLKNVLPALRDWL